MKLVTSVMVTLVLSSSLVCHIASAFVVHGSIAAKQTGAGWKHDPSNALMVSMIMKHDRQAGQESGTRDKSFAAGIKAALTTAAIGLALTGPMVIAPPARVVGAAVAGSRTIGDISASGLLFKDKLNVEAFSDPKIKGVTLYLSDFSRPVGDKLLSGDFFSEPSSASLFCVRSGPLEISAGINTSKEGEELFKEDRSFFKSIMVRRLYDKDANTVVYVSYSTKLDPNSDSNKSRFKSSLCALTVD